MDNIQPGASVATAPPPPSEVKIRTMKSDLAMLAASGGGMPRFENVKIKGLSAAAETPTAAAKTESKSNLLLIVLLVVTVAALAVVGWFVYKKFVG
jgi:hypothetical protein